LHSEKFDSPDLIFDWMDNREMDPKTAPDIRVQETKAGIIAVDEAREERGEDPLGGAYAIPIALTATGYVASQTPEEQQANQEAQQQALRDAAQAKQGRNEAPSVRIMNTAGQKAIVRIRTGLKSSLRA
jgi:hypothetical protein